MTYHQLLRILAALALAGFILSGTLFAAVPERFTGMPPRSKRSPIAQPSTRLHGDNLNHSPTDNGKPVQVLGNAAPTSSR